MTTKRVNIGIARHTVSKRWHIVVVSEDKPDEATIHDDLTFATEAEARAELERLLEGLGSPYTVDRMQ